MSEELNLLPHEVQFLSDLFSGTLVVHERGGIYYDQEQNKLDLFKIMLYMVHIDDEVKDLTDGTT